MVVDNLGAGYIYLSQKLPRLDQSCDAEKSRSHQCKDSLISCLGMRIYFQGGGRTVLTENNIKCLKFGTV
jgi:hypothetical protein